MFDKEFFDLETACNVLDVTFFEMFGLLGRGELKCLKINNIRMIPSEQVEKYIVDHKEIYKWNGDTVKSLKDKFGINELNQRLDKYELDPDTAYASFLAYKRETS